MFDRVWEEIHAKRTWGRYPKEELVRWVMRSYGSSPERSALRFLDLGCGAGSSTWFLAREGFSVVSLDGAYSAVKRVNADDRVVADANNLPFKDDSFDAIIDIVCVAHNPMGDIGGIINEMERVLKPGGRVFSALPAIEGTHEAYEHKGAITLFSLQSATSTYASKFKIDGVDYTMTCEGARYTKLWFVKATKELL